MNTAIISFQDLDVIADRAAANASLDVARTWFRNNITIVWRITQAPRDQLSNTFIDIETIESNPQTDRYRREVMREKLAEFRLRVRSLKANM